MDTIKQSSHCRSDLIKQYLDGKILNTSKNVCEKTVQ